MEARPPPVPTTEPPRERAPRPATPEDLRNLRRWLLVTGVWAVAATAIAAIALVVANRANDDEEVARASGQIGVLRRDLNERIDALSDRVDELPRSRDVAKLDGRLKAVEDDAGSTSDRIDRLDGRIDDLESKVRDLERSGAAGTDTTATTP